MNVKDIYITKSQSERLYNIAKPIIALTGGIATGKTTVSNYIKDKHQIEITDADALIKEIYRQDKTISFIKGRCSTAVINGQIDFKILRQSFFSDSNLKNIIEKFLYAELEILFKRKVLNSNQNFVLYDVPLLFEKKLDKLIDFSILVYATAETQKQRIRDRDGSDEQTINNILNSQLPIDDKKSVSDFIILNEHEIKKTNRNDWPEIDFILKEIFN
jgi:dephospho-CoA kinase